VRVHKAIRARWQAPRHRNFNMEYSIGARSRFASQLPAKREPTAADKAAVLIVCTAEREGKCSQAGDEVSILKVRTPVEGEQVGTVHRRAGTGDQSDRRRFLNRSWVALAAGAAVCAARDTDASKQRTPIMAFLPFDDSGSLSKLLSWWLLRPDVPPRPPRILGDPALETRHRRSSDAR